MKGVRILMFLLVLITPLPGVDGQESDTPVAHEVREILRAASPSDVRQQLPRLRTQLRRDNFHWTPLMVAAAVATDPAVIHALVAAGEDVNARSLDDMTPLMFASAFNRDVAIVDALLEAGAPVDSRTRDNWVPGYGVARYTGTNVEIGDLFAGFSLTADHDEPRQNGWTALFFAARYNPDSAAMERLLDAGADSKTRDEAGALPIPSAAN